MISAVARSTLTPAVRRLFLVLLAFLALVSMAEAFAFWLAARHVAQAKKRWARLGQPMDAFEARFPATPDSPAAERLDEMTRPLGIRMIPRPGERVRWDGENGDELRALGAELIKMDRPEFGSSPSLPAGAETLLRRERDRLDAIVAHILEAAPLAWEMDVGKGAEAPILGLLGHRQLSSLLLGRAWFSARDGRIAEAEQALEASWRLNASYLQRPDLIPQLSAVVVAQMQHGVLRTFPNPANVWLARMEERPFGRNFTHALQLQAWNLLSYGRRSQGSFGSRERRGPSIPRVGWGSIPEFLATPYTRLSVAGASEVLLRASRDLGSRRRCDVDTRLYAKELDDSLPRWNIIARIGTPSVALSWTAFRETDFDRELTERVLRARIVRTTSGSWPSSGGGSQVCEGVRWEYEPAPGGALDIRAKPRPFLPDDPRWDWALRLGSQ